jgi:hypothetical protein
MTIPALAPFTPASQEPSWLPLYVLAEYDKIKRITMPFGDDYLLYVTTELEADHFILINQIRKLEAGLNYSN